MIYLIIAVILLAGAIYLLFQSNRKKGKEISSLDDEVIGLKSTIKARDHLIKQIQEVTRETSKKKKKIHTGSDNDKFNNSLDILSELPADSPASKD